MSRHLPHHAVMVLLVAHLPPSWLYEHAFWNRFCHAHLPPFKPYTPSAGSGREEHRICSRRGAPERRASVYSGLHPAPVRRRRSRTAAQANVMAMESEPQGDEAAAAQGSKAAPAPASNNSMDIKHPLQDKWTLWFDNPKLKKPEESWEDTLKNIMSFDTVEDFWCLYGNILPASRIPTGSNYSVFKAGVKPMWEVRPPLLAHNRCCSVARTCNVCKPKIAHVHDATITSKCIFFWFRNMHDWYCNACLLLEHAHYTCLNVNTHETHNRQQYLSVRGRTRPTPRVASGC
jgi:Eukaryotic initiation factor 4E